MCSSMCHVRQSLWRFRRPFELGEIQLPIGALFGNLARRPAHLGQALALLDRLQDRLRQRLRIAIREEPAVLARLHPLPVAGDVGDQHRTAAGHRLQQRDGCAVAVRGGDIQIGRAVITRQVGIADLSGEQHPWIISWQSFSPPVARIWRSKPACEPLPSIDQAQLRMLCGGLYKGPGDRLHPVDRFPAAGGEQGKGHFDSRRSQPLVAVLCLRV